MSMFAAKKSGMASMVEGLIPPQVMEALTMAKEKLPLVIHQITQTVERVEATQNRIESKLDLILGKLESMRLNNDPSATPESTPLQDLSYRLADSPRGRGTIKEVHLLEE